MGESAEQDGQQADNLHRWAAGGVSGDDLRRVRRLERADTVYSAI